MVARQHELHMRIISILIITAIKFINAFSSGLFPVVAFSAYTFLAGHELRIDVIFPALQLFTLLEHSLKAIPNQITTYLNTYVALGRIEDFMVELDREKPTQIAAADGLSSLQLQDCTFAWPGQSTPVLRNVSLKFQQGLTVVCGVVGAGKTALLQALLGELDKLGGVTYIPDEMIGYCSQTPWLQSMSIRDNILFSSPYEERRYRDVLDACALLPDLADLKHGDLSFVGENGVGLSGGQKARVALARAVYSRASILILDDPISALDHNTAEALVRKCFSGPLVRGRTIVLVTHRTELVRHLADQIVEIADGQASIIDKDDLIDIGGDDEARTSHNAETDEAEMESDQDTTTPEKFMDEEFRAEWGVKASVYWTYIKAGKRRWWTILVLLLTIYRLVVVGQTWFLKEWGEKYQGKYHEVLLNWRAFSFFTDPVRNSAFERAIPLPSNPLDKLPLPAVDVRPWLLVYFLIIIFQSTVLLLLEFASILIVYSAAKRLFREVMIRVSHANFRFYDVTPMGRLMNRLTSDMGTIDGPITTLFEKVTNQSITWISSVVVIASVTPSFLILSLGLTAGFVMIFLQFLPTSQSLRRLETVSLSPLMSNFGELIPK
jgi:ABC-type multidrug transport system fused ATPase/permease subunit